MKALSIRQPWTWAILFLPADIRKDVENRDWTPRNPGLRFRGRCVLHAGAYPGDREWNRRWSAYCEAALGIPFDHPDPLIPEFDHLKFGALLGTVEVVDVVAKHASPWFFGPYGLVLREPRPFSQPIPYGGQLGFFDVPDGILPHA